MMTEDGYNIRPNYKQKFRPLQSTAIIQQILTDRLSGATYHPDTCSQWTREIADEIKNKLKGLQIESRARFTTLQVHRQRCDGRGAWRRRTVLNLTLVLVRDAFGMQILIMLLSTRSQTTLCSV
ncbi:flagellar inner arm dynein light chain [Gorgonomyces haynaldii]|nr:flagellar inner arm dynein light chain [Gorgonomyces haynaldii]